MRNKEFKVGLFIASGLVLLYLGFNYLKGIDFFSSTSKYYAVYDNVDQLAVSNPVLVNGFAVGRVSKIKILQNKQNRVLVELDIDSEVKLGDSTKAILSSDFLGSKSILLNIGKVITPRKPNDTLIAEVAKGVVDMISETASPVADNIQTTLRKLNTILDNLSNNSKQLEGVFAKFQSTPDLLNKSLANVNGRVDELALSYKEVATNLNASLVELQPTLANFKVMTDSLKQLELNKTISQTQKTLQQLNETLAKLTKGDNTAGRLMTEDSLYVNLNNLIQRLDTLAVHFNEKSKTLFSTAGKEQQKNREGQTQGRRGESEERNSKKLIYIFKMSNNLANGSGIQ